MELSKKYKALLIRAKIMKSLTIHKTKKLVKSASDTELVLIHNLCELALKDRGIL